MFIMKEANTHACIMNYLLNECIFGLMRICGRSGCNLAHKKFYSWLSQQMYTTSPVGYNPSRTYRTLQGKQDLLTAVHGHVFTCSV